jgi:acyl-CoA thioester hydrolase
MAKPDPASLDPARYPFHCQIATRFGDLDTNMHLNNVALAGILEDGRVRFHHASGFHEAMNAPASTPGMSAMVASFNIEYLGQAWYPQPLDVYVAVSRVGRTSYVVQQLINQEDRIVSFAQSVMVCVADSQPVIIPAAFIDGISDWMLRL